MKKPDYIPKDYPLVEVVENMDELYARPFGPGTNMFVLPRRLKGDFNALAAHLGRDGFRVFNDKYIFESAASDAPPAAREAARAIYADMNAYSMAGKTCELRVVPDSGYLFTPQEGMFRDGAYDWHADPPPPRFHAHLGAEGVTIHHYNAPSTLHLPFTDAVRRIDNPETRARLAAAFPGANLEKEYGQWYAPKPAGARPFSLMPGDISRHAAMGSGTGAPPHVHAAPREEKGAPPRLLLVR